ncbi:hypothetical protein [Brevibacterium sp. RIT 803]|uniref:hypothetical protein n=1 Tax=Brevibacterium sp. RIT 803 TaxID=2810210 RepID=UPI0020799584|nr:hypothetical protein [Brevibacterium sp. RIT 803]
MSSHAAFDGHPSAFPPQRSPRPPRPPRRLGLPLWAIIALALLAAPRVILHDLDIITAGTLINAAFVFVPLLVWIGVVLWAAVPNAFLTLLAVGVFYGVFLAAGHQIFWTAQFDGAPPRLGGNLSDLDPLVSSLIVRTFAAASSLITGTAVGAGVGLLTWVLDRLLRRNRTVSAAVEQG